MNTKTVVLLAAAVVALAACDLFSQEATWNGGDGNWNDANWTGGAGPAGAPDLGESVILPASTGTVSITTNLNNAVGAFGGMSQRGGSLVVSSGGRADFSGSYLVAHTSPSTAQLTLSSGQLYIGGELSVGYGNGDGGGTGKGTVMIEGSSVLHVGANMDTWWDDGAKLIITGGGADIEVGQTFYLGTATTMTANINASGFSTINVLGMVNFPGGTLDVKFVDGYVPPLGTSWNLFDSPFVGGRISTVNVPNFGPGTLVAVDYRNGGEYGQVVALDYLNTLNLKVNTASGQAVLENPVVGGDNLDIDGYIIRSASGSLVTGGLTGMGQPGWLPGLAPSQSATLLSESNLNGSSVVAQGQTYGLGSLFKTGGTQDLTLEYHLTGGRTLRGTVQYVVGLEGDYNGNGLLDAADLDLQADVMVKQPSPLPAEYDLNNDGAVDFADREMWLHDLKNVYVGDADLNGEFNSADFVQVFIAGKYETGQTALWEEGDWDGDQVFGSADFVAAFIDGGYETGARPGAVSAVPEPAGLLLMLLGMVACAWRRR